MVKLLQLTPVSIAQPRSGVQLRNYHIAQQLARSFEVTHIGFFKSDEPVADIHSSGPVRIVPILRDRQYTFGKLLRGLIGPTPAAILNYYNAAMTSALQRELETGDYDIVQLEGVEVAGYLDLVQKSPKRPRCISMDWHTIESETLLRHAEHAATPFHRAYVRRSAKQVEVIERRLLRELDLHIAMSEREKALMLSVNPKANIVVAENGVDADYYISQLPECKKRSDWAERRRVLYVGAMDYNANVNAMLYFAEQVWPQLHREFPELILTIVGRNPVPKVRELAKQEGIEVTGTVPDVRPYYAEAFVTVVPLLSGGGTRLKIPESMAAGIPVVSTTLGAEGLQVHPEIDCLIADSPVAFCSQVGRLRKDFSLWQKLATAGRGLARNTYDWGATCYELPGHYFNLLNPAHTNSAGKQHSVG